MIVLAYYNSFSSATNAGKAAITKIETAQADIRNAFYEMSSVFYNISSDLDYLLNGVENEARYSDIGLEQIIDRISEVHDYARKAASVIGVDYSRRRSISGSRTSGGSARTIRIKKEVGEAARSLGYAANSVSDIARRIDTAAMATAEGAETTDMEIFREKTREAVLKTIELSENIRKFEKMLRQIAASYNRVAEKAVSRAKNV